jgi:sarcosine oxidase subunit gamma
MMNAFTAPVATSPLAEAIAASGGTSTAAVSFVDHSLAPRYGCKGKGAAAWLQSLGLPLPAGANRWLPLPGGLIARLGHSEFLIDGNASIVARLQDSPLPADVAAVLRQDAALALSGPGLPELLLQTCNVNFAALDLAESPVVLTTMTGIVVTVIPGASSYRIWCDGVYGAALWETLFGIAGELSGASR